MKSSVQVTEGCASVVDGIVRRARGKVGELKNAMCKTRMRQLLNEYKKSRLEGHDHNAACSVACKRVKTSDAYKDLFREAVTAAAREEAHSRHPSRRVSHAA